MNKMRLTVAIIALVAVVSFGSVFALMGNSLFPTAKKCVQKAYFDGKVYCFFVTKAITNASQSLLASARPLYVASYPQLNSMCSSNLSSCKPQTLPSGYAPQCSPCIQEARFPYHDHILGSSQTPSGNASWVVIVVNYKPSYSSQGSFTPINSASALASGENAGDFLPINPSGTNQYEMNTHMILVLQITPQT